MNISNFLAFAGIPTNNSISIENTFFKNYDTVIFDLDGTIWDVITPSGEEEGAYFTDAPYSLLEKDVITDIKGNTIRLQPGVREVLELLDDSGINVGIMSNGEKFTDEALTAALPTQAQPSIMLLKKFGIYQYFNYDIILKAFVDKAEYVKAKGRTLFIDDMPKNTLSVDQIPNVDVLQRKTFQSWEQLLQSPRPQVRASETFFDSTPSETVVPEDRNFTNPLPDVQIRRTNPKRYDPRTDWYETVNEFSHDSPASNRTDNEIQLEASSKKGVFICLWAPPEVKKKLNKIVDLEDELHVTLFYNSDVKVDDNELLERISYFIKHENLDKLSCEFSGIGEFNSKDHPLVALINVNNGARFRTSLCSIIEELSSSKLRMNFDFQPHCTLSYTRQPYSIDMLPKFKWTPKYLSVKFASSNKNYYINLVTGRITEGVKVKASTDPGFDYDRSRENRDFQFEPDGTPGLSPLDMQQSYDTDLSLPDVDKVQKEIDTLDWHGRENLQLWTSLKDLSWRNLVKSA